MCPKPSACAEARAWALRRLLVAAFALALCAVPAGAQPEPGEEGDGEAIAGYPYASPDHERPDPETLSAYGAWQSAPRYGRFWRPRVAAGWLPYRDGRWVWTSYGWTWVSREPWSWTYHYGNWTFLPAWGWGWIPGSVWGPSWVRWSSYGNWVGWAPLSPWRRPVYNDYLFVPRYDLCAPYLGQRAVRWNRVPRRPLVHWRDYATRGPERADIERGSRHPLYVRRDRPDAASPPWRRHPSPFGSAASGPLIHRPDGPDAGRRARELRTPRVLRWPQGRHARPGPPVARPHPQRPPAGASAPLVLERTPRAPAGRAPGRPSADGSRAPLVHRGGGHAGQARGGTIGGLGGVGGLHPGR